MAKDLNRHFSKEQIWRPKGTWIDAQSCQVLGKSKTIMRHHLTLVRMATIKKSTTNKCWRVCEDWFKSGSPILQAHSLCLNHQGSPDPVIPLLGIYPEKTLISKDTWTPIFTAALFTVAKTGKQPKCPSTEKWIKKIWYTMEYYSAIKKNEIIASVATWMDLEIVILSEISQTDKEKCHMTTLICRI